VREFLLFAAVQWICWGVWVVRM